MAQAAKYGIRDYEKTPDGVVFEVIDGVPQVTAAPFLDHQRVLQALYEAFVAHVRPRKAGEVFIAPVDVVLSDHDIVQPDLLFISSPRLGILTKRNVRGAPDVAVEIVGGSSARRDLVVKRKLYARHGILEYWLVDLKARRIEILGLRDGVYERVDAGSGSLSVGSRVLDGLAVVPAAIF